MDYYIYYLSGKKPDIAVVEACSKECAVNQLRKYYNNVLEENVTKIDCHRSGYVDGIMIIGEY